MRRGSDFSLVKTIGLGDDADNIRVESEQQVIVGYGEGGLAGPASTRKPGRGARTSRLPRTRRVFSSDRQDGRIFVNEPGAFRGLP